MKCGPLPNCTDTGGVLHDAGLTRILKASDHGCLMSCVIPRNMPAVAWWPALLRQGSGAPVLLEHAAITSI